MKSIKTNTMLNAIRMVLTVVVPIITFTYTSRIFLPEGNGQLNFASSVVQVFTLLASLGIYTYGVREGAKVRHSKALFSKLAKELFIINIVSCVIAYVLFFFIIFWFSKFKYYRELLLINSLTIGFSALGMDWVYGVYEDYLLITIRQIIIQAFIVITMFLFVKTREDINLWAFLTVISGVGANVFNVFHSRKYIDFGRLFHHLKTVKKHIKPILILFYTQLAAKVYSNIDTILLGLMSTDRYVGLYSASVKVNTILITFFSAMTPVFLPRLVGYIQNGEEKGYYLFLKKIFSVMIGMSIPMIIGIEFLSEDIVRILAGNAFFDAMYTLRILAPIILITTISSVIYYDIMTPNGKELQVLLCTIASTAINLTTSIVLIPFLNQNGAAIGSLIAELLALLIAVVLCIKNDNEIVKAVPDIRNYLIGGCAVAILLFVINQIQMSSILKLIVSIGLSLCVYGFILMIRQDYLWSEMMLITKNFKRRVHEKISSQ